jgi:N-acetylglutamate synthase-like GNAT family acetyltransferase
MIRPAKVTDVEQLLKLLKDFASASLVNYQAWSEQDLSCARERLTNVILYHYLMIAEHEGQVVGMIGAMKEQDPWIGNRTRMRELFWWVTPAFRKGRLSVELYLRWETDCERFIRDKLVDQVSLSTQPGSTDVNLGKRGWKCVEQHWIKE